MHVEEFSMPRFSATVLLFLMAISALGFEVQAAAVEVDSAASDAVEEAAETSEAPEAKEPAEDETDKEEAEETVEKKPEENGENDKDKPSAKDEQTKKKAAEKPKPFKVEGKPLNVEVELDGAFVAEQMEEVLLRPEVWKKFKVLEAVEHGSHVKKGDFVVRFDPEDLEKKLDAESIDQRLSELAFLQAEEEAPRLKKLLEMSFAKAKLTSEQFEQDYAYYHSTDRPFNIDIANYRFKDAQEDLASQREELEQLLKMYEADELIEETEKIVLRRQRFQVETAELVMELNTASRDYALNVSIPRMDEFYRTAKEKNEIAFKQAKTEYETDLVRQVYELEKRREVRARSVESHAKLVSDKGLMMIRAPTDGVVYFGRCVDGKWPEVKSMQAKLKPLGTATANTVLMAIVKQRPLMVFTSFGEKDLPNVKSGLSIVISPVADDELELSGKVAEMDTVPGKSNKFKMQLDVDNSALPAWLVAGLTCKAKVTTYHNEKALEIPLNLVQTDEDNKKIKYVMRVDAEQDEPVKRKVKLGRKQGKMVEVLQGLEEGDEIVKEEKKDDKDKNDE